MRLFGDLKCSNCHRKIKDDENIFIKVQAKDLHGYTNLDGWSNEQYKLCETCAKQLK